MTATHIPSASTTTHAMRSLLAELDAIVTRRPEETRPAAVALALQRHIRRRHLLTPAQRRSSADHYRTNVVHVHPAGLYSVVALVWRPGQRTSIHSHRSWCAVAVHEGCEVERTFRRDGDTLVEAGSRTLERGGVTWLLAGDDDIHDVVNAAPTTSISVHVYGLDYRRTGSSILDVYAEPGSSAPAAAA